MISECVSQPGVSSWEHLLRGAAMLRKLVLIFAVVWLSSILVVAQELSKVDIFAGYQHLHASSGVSGVDGVDFNGWNAALSGYFTPNFDVTADFSGNYAKPNVLGVGVDTKFYTFLLGPTVRVPNATRITRFWTCVVWGRARFCRGIGFQLFRNGFYL